MDRLFVLLAVLTLAFASSPGPASAKADPAQTCQAAKLKAVGQYDACVLAADARAVLRGGVPDTSKCQTKLASRIAKAEERGGGECPTTGDGTALQGLSDAHANDVLTALAGSSAACGDGVATPPEPCDGNDVAGETCSSQGFDAGALACTSQCAFDTTGCLTFTCNPFTQDCAQGDQSCYVGFGGSACLP